MSITLGELNFKTIFGLGKVPVEYCTLLDVHSKVVEKLAMRVAFTRGAATNALLSQSREFSPGSTQPVNVTALLSGGTPAFLEMRDGDGEFSPVQSVGLNQLSDARNSGIFAWAFYRDESNGDGQEPRAFVQFSQIPSGVCRFRYDRSDIVKLTGAVSPLPETVADLVVKEAQISIIALINTKIMQNRKKFGLSVSEVQLEQQTYLSLARQCAIDAQPLEILWRQWSFKDLGAETNFRKATPRSGAVYGD